MKYNKQAKNLIIKKVETSLTNKKDLLQKNFYEILSKQDQKNTKDLGWLDAPNNTKVVNEVKKFIIEQDIRNFSKIIFLGIGGATITAEMLSNMLHASNNQQYEIIDSIDIDELSVIAKEITIENTLFVVMSKSGSTIEVLSQLHFFWKHFPSGANYIAITESESKLYEHATKNQFLKIFECPKNIGGRFASLSYLGIIPALLMDIDMNKVMHGAIKAKDACSISFQDSAPASLGKYIANAINEDFNNIIIIIPDNLLFFAKWIEQMIAESLGKNGTGITPIICCDINRAANLQTKSIIINYLEPIHETFDCPVLNMKLDNILDIGQQIYIWQVAIAYSGQLLGINAFDQPDVEKVKIDPSAVTRVNSNQSDYSLNLEFIQETIKNGSCLHLLSFGKKSKKYQSLLNEQKRILESLLQIPVNIHYAPRYLHSVGQLHKGGKTGIHFIFIDNIKMNKAKIPNYNFSFSDIAAAQLRNDSEYLTKISKKVAITNIKDLQTMTEQCTQSL